MTRAEAKKLFRDDTDSFGKPHGVMAKVDAIFDDFERDTAKDSRLAEEAESAERFRNAVSNLIKLNPKDCGLENKDRFINRIKKEALERVALKGGANEF